MLCDDVIHGGDPSTWKRPYGVRRPGAPLREWLAIAANRVREAQRFAIAKEALNVVTHVGQSKPSSLIAGLGIARLPFKKLFIEYDWMARLKILTEDFGYTDQREDRNITKLRYGLLVEATDETYRRGTLHVIMQHFDTTPRMSPLFLDFDFSAREDNQVWRWHQQNGSLFTVEDVQRRAKERDRSDYSPRFAKQPQEAVAMAEMNNIFHMRYDERAKPHVNYIGEIEGVERRDRYVSDWQINMAGEARFFLGILMLLNSRNLAEITEISVREANRMRHARARRDAPAVVSHRRVSIKLSRIAANRLKAQGVPANEVAFHMVRGHWKIRRTGVFWWTPHFAGNRAKGVIVKDYDIEP